MAYEAAGGGETLAPSSQVMAVSLWRELASCHILTDGWAGQNNHSNPVPSLPKASDLPDHYPLVTSTSQSWSCLGQHFTSSYSFPEWSRDHTSPACCCSILTFLEIVEYSGGMFDVVVVKGCALFVIIVPLQSRKSEQSEGSLFFFPVNKCFYLLLHILLTFAVVG